MGVDDGKPSDRASVSRGLIFGSRIDGLITFYFIFFDRIGDFYAVFIFGSLVERKPPSVGCLRDVVCVAARFDAVFQQADCHVLRPQSVRVVVVPPNLAGDRNLRLRRMDQRDGETGSVFEVHFIPVLAFLVPPFFAVIQVDPLPFGREKNFAFLSDRGCDGSAPVLFLFKLHFFGSRFFPGFRRNADAEGDTIRPQLILVVAVLPDDADRNLSVLQPMGGKCDVLLDPDGITGAEAFSAVGFPVIEIKSFVQFLIDVAGRGEFGSFQELVLLVRIIFLVPQARLYCHGAVIQRVEEIRFPDLFGILPVEGIHPDPADILPRRCRSEQITVANELAVHVFRKLMRGIHVVIILAVFRVLSGTVQLPVPQFSEAFACIGRNLNRVGAPVRLLVFLLHLLDHHFLGVLIVQRRTNITADQVATYKPADLIGEVIVVRHKDDLAAAVRKLRHAGIGCEVVIRSGFFVEVGFAGRGVDFQRLRRQNRSGTWIDFRFFAVVLRFGPQVQDDGLSGVQPQEFLYRVENHAEAQIVPVRILRHIPAAALLSMADPEVFAVVIIHISADIPFVGLMLVIQAKVKLTAAVGQLLADIFLLRLRLWRRSILHEPGKAACIVAGQSKRQSGRNHGQAGCDHLCTGQNRRDKRKRS